MKKLVLWMGLVTCLFQLAACGGGGGGSTPVTAPAATVTGVGTAGAISVITAN